MKEEVGNLWDHADAGRWVCITTNGEVTKAGTAVMGRGTALQAKRRWPALPGALGDAIRRTDGRRLHIFQDWRLVAFPVKRHWADPADLELIKDSAFALAMLVTVGAFDIAPPVYLPRPGCGNGQLAWADVRPVIARILPDEVIVIDRVAS